MLVSFGGLFLFLFLTRRFWVWDGLKIFTLRSVQGTLCLVSRERPGSLGPCYVPASPVMGSGTCDSQSISWGLSFLNYFVGLWHDKAMTNLAGGGGLVAQSCLTLCNPMDGSTPGSSVHRISQAGVLKWLAIPFSRGSSQPRDWTWVSHIARVFFTVWATWEGTTF